MCYPSRERKGALSGIPKPEARACVGPPSTWPRCAWPCHPTTGAAKSRATFLLTAIERTSAGCVPLKRSPPTRGRFASRGGRDGDGVYRGGLQETLLGLDDFLPPVVRQAGMVIAALLVAERAPAVIERFEGGKHVEQESSFRGSGQPEPAAQPAGSFQHTRANQIAQHLGKVLGRDVRLSCDLTTRNGPLLLVTRKMDHRAQGVFACKTQHPRKTSTAGRSDRGGAMACPENGRTGSATSLDGGLPRRRHSSGSASRTGRRTSSPPQFGHLLRIRSRHARQYVHSCEQM